ncbi:MAG: GntR family transcriptional regulator [Clostridia bacterium]|nr:GntR family transcriptional regulator [Clostridia bacterium]
MRMTEIITVKQQVYNILKTRIADGTYKHGQRLFEIELAEDLRVSRSPIREALKQLVQEGVLVESPNKGVSLRAFTDRDITEIFTFRDLVECFAIDFLAANPSCFPAEELRENLKALQNLDAHHIDYVVQQDINPHDVFVQATQNSYLIASYHRASFCTMSYHRALFADGNYEKNLAEHMNIVYNLLKNDFDHAKLALKAHLAASRDVICAAIRAGGI